MAPSGPILTSIGRKATCSVLISSGCSSRREAGAVVGEDEPADAIAAEVVGEEVALPVVGQMPAADDLQAAVFRAAGVESLEDPRVVGAAVK